MDIMTGVDASGSEGDESKLEIHFVDSKETQKVETVVQ
jgi:hypothetical protein